MSRTSRRHTGRIVDRSVRIRTTPERAWEAWADPAKIAAWFVDRAEGVAQPGEIMTWIFDAFGYRIPVPIVEAEHGRTFVTGSSDGPHGQPYVMEVTITKAEGDTVIRLVNSGFSVAPEADEEFEGVVSGWALALATLKTWLERYHERRRTHRIVMRPHAFSWDALAPWFHTVDGRRAWLEPLIAADAPVLGDSGREVLLDWPDRDGVVGLKAFSVGAEQRLALDLSVWSGVPPDLDALEAEAVRALDRLVARLPAA